MSSNNTSKSSPPPVFKVTPGGMTVSSSSSGKVFSSSGSHLGYTFNSNSGPGSNIWDSNGNWVGKLK